MREGLLDRIRGHGHWRVNFQPSSGPETKRLLGNCREIVEKSSVSIRGWDFPHVSRNSDTGGYVFEANFIENWTEWYGFVEFWRIYPSTQFLSYISLREDTMPEDYGVSARRIVLTTDVIYQLTEVFEFCHRLFRNGLYGGGARVSVSLNNTKGRVLLAARYRVPFFEIKETNAEKIEIIRVLDAEDLDERYREIAVNCCAELFDRFGWNPDFSQLQAEQESFYRGQT